MIKPVEKITPAQASYLETIRNQVGQDIFTETWRRLGLPDQAIPELNFYAAGELIRNLMRERRRLKSRQVVNL